MPVLLSNNPEIVTGSGLLAGTAQPSSGTRKLIGAITQPGCPLDALSDFSIYLFHINKAGSSRRFHVLLANPGPDAVTIRGEGSTHAGAWAFGASSSVRTALDRLTGDVDVLDGIRIEPGATARVGIADVAHGSPVDGSYRITVDGGCVAASVVATAAGASVATAAAEAKSGFAPGKIHSPGPDKLGRAAGVYATDGWTSDAAVALENAPAVQGFRFDDVTQGAPALGHYADSDNDSTGNYGARYEQTWRLENRTGSCLVVELTFESYPAGHAPEALGVWTSSLTSQPPSRLWDGHALVDGALTKVQTKPTSESAMRAPLARRYLEAGETRALHTSIPVPGLITIPAALVFRTLTCDGSPVILAPPTGGGPGAGGECEGQGCP